MYYEYGMTVDLAGDHIYTLEELLNTDHASAVSMVNSAFNEDMKIHPELYFEGHSARSRMTSVRSVITGQRRALYCAPSSTGWDRMLPEARKLCLRLPKTPEKL